MSVGEKPEQDNLFTAFREDHAVLGRGFHELSRSLRGNDLAAASEIARRLDAEAGAHIAFEERHFYPALAGLIGAAEVDAMYHEHDQGLELVRALKDRDPSAPLPDGERRRLLALSEAMEAHVAGCGELFEAMGRIPQAEQAALFRDLLDWRRKRPCWSELANPAASPRVG